MSCGTATGALGGEKKRGCACTGSWDGEVKGSSIGGGAYSDVIERKLARPAGKEVGRGRQGLYQGEKKRIRRRKERKTERESERALIRERRGQKSGRVGSQSPREESGWEGAFLCLPGQWD